jgi:hypothetical protein
MGHDARGPRRTNSHLKTVAVLRGDGGERREPLTITTKSRAKCLKGTVHVDKVVDEARGSFFRIGFPHVALIHP